MKESLTDPDDQNPSFRTRSIFGHNNKILDHPIEDFNPYADPNKNQDNIWDKYFEGFGMAWAEHVRAMEKNLAEATELLTSMEPATTAVVTSTKKRKADVELTSGNDKVAKVSVVLASGGSFCESCKKHCDDAWSCESYVEQDEEQDEE